MRPDAEAIERSALQALFDAAPNETRERLGLSVQKIGSATCFVTRREPNIMLNRVFGLEAEAADTRAEIEQIRDLYAGAGIDQVFVHRVVGPNAQQVTAWLTTAGFQRHRGWMKFERGPAPPAAVRSDLSVRRVDTAHAQDFADILTPAFDLAPCHSELLMALFNASGWHLYMSFDGDTPAGTGGLFVQDDVGFLDWGSTHPDFRRRRGQAALLAARIRDALDMGCRWLITETGEAVAGDPQHSYHNILRAGFRESYLRENWSLAEWQPENG